MSESQMASDPFSDRQWILRRLIPAALTYFVSRLIIHGLAGEAVGKFAGWFVLVLIALWPLNDTLAIERVVGSRRRAIRRAFVAATILASITLALDLVLGALLL